LMNIKTHIQLCAVNFGILLIIKKFWVVFNYKCNGFCVDSVCNGFC